MNKSHKFFIVLFIALFTFESKAHVEHYSDLKLIEFDIFRNNKNIGKHVFSFSKTNDMLAVKSEISFEIKKFGVVLYTYNVKGTEYFKDGKLIKFNSKTEQNGKKKYVNIKSDKNDLLIDGSSFKGKVQNDYILGTWWNHSIIKAEAQISAVSGRIIKQKVTFIGKEDLKIGEKVYKTLHFNFSSTDQSLSKGKKLNTDVWYEEDTLNWIKASFKKKGDWEYKLVTLR
jgi:hypothetical protein